MEFGEIETCVIIGGPTASGKSALAVRLAEKLGGEVVNADAMQVYADLPCLTAAPDAEAQARIPHHFYGVIDGGIRYSVAQWLASVGGIVADIRARGRIPILVGGTGLYIRAAITGLTPIPDIPPDIRQKAQAMLSDMGGKALKVELAKTDPDLANRLHDGDSTRLIRGMEVMLATGTPLSRLQQAPPTGMLPKPIFTINLAPPRAILYDRIKHRFATMLEEGVLAEVEQFANRNLDPSLPLMKAVGVQHLMALLNGTIDEAEAIALACRDSRRLAKRQMTWFRHQYQADLTVSDSEDDRQVVEKIRSRINHNKRG